SRRLNAFESALGQVGPAATRNHGPNGLWTLRHRDQSSGRARAGAEVAQRQISCLGLPSQPGAGAGKPLRQECDIEPDVPGPHIQRLLLGREQIEQQCGKAGLLEDLRDETVSRAMPAAAAAMCKRYDSTCTLRNCQRAVELDLPGINLNFLFLCRSLRFTGHA